MKESENTSQAKSDSYIEFLAVDKTSRLTTGDVCPRVWCHVLSCIWLFVTPWTVAHQAPLLWNFSGKNTGVGSISSSRGSSWPRDQTLLSCISCIAGWFFTCWPTAVPLDFSFFCSDLYGSIYRIKKGIRISKSQYSISSFSIWWRFVLNFKL